MANDSILSSSTTSNLNNGYETAVDNSTMSLYYSVNGTLIDDTLSCTTNDYNLNDIENMEIFKNIRSVENLNSLSPILQNNLKQIKAICSTPTTTTVAAKSTEKNNSVSEDAIDTSTNDTIETVIESFNVKNKHLKITSDESALNQIDDSIKSATINELIMNNSNNFASVNKSLIKSTEVLSERFLLQENVNIDKYSDAIVTEQIINPKTLIIEENPSAEITACAKKLSSSDEYLKNEIIGSLSAFTLSAKRKIANSNKEKSIVKKMIPSLNTTRKRLSISTEFRKQSLPHKRISVLHTISEDKVSITNKTSRLHKQATNISKIPEGRRKSIPPRFIKLRGTAMNEVNNKKISGIQSKVAPTSSGSMLQEFNQSKLIGIKTLRENDMPIRPKPTFSVSTNNLKVNRRTSSVCSPTLPKYPRRHTLIANNTSIPIKKHSFLPKTSVTDKIETNGKPLTPKVRRSLRPQSFATTSTTSTTKTINNKPAKISKIATKALDCDICKKSFRLTSSLLAHKKTHLAQTANSGFKCKYCDKTFVVKNAYDTHLIKYCIKIPDLEKKKLFLPPSLMPSNSENFSQSKKRISTVSKLNSVAKAINTTTHKSFSSTSSLSSDDESQRGNPGMGPPLLKSSAKKLDALAHSGIYRTPSKKIHCYTCKLTFPDILSFTNHTEMHSTVQ